MQNKSNIHDCSANIAAVHYWEPVSQCGLLVVLLARV